MTSLERRRQLDEEALLNARAHLLAAVEESFSAVGAAGRQLSPMGWAKKHPVIVTGVAVAAGVLVTRSLAGKVADGAPASNEPWWRRALSIVIASLWPRVVALGTHWLSRKLVP